MVLSRFQESLFRITVILGVASGFSYQTWKISNEYFRYPTSTLVSLEDYPNVTIVPQLGFRYWVYWVYWTSYGRTLSDIFNAINKTEILRFKIHINLHKEEILLNGANFVIMKPQNVTNRSPQQLYLRREPIYYVGLNISQISTRIFGAFVQPYFGDFEGLQKMDALIDCRNIKMRVCAAFLTYTTKITKLQPPPYDTNCLTYKVYNYSSKENCISECLNNFTQGHGLMMESNVIKRSKYENSSLKIIPGILRTMRNDSDDEISTESIKNTWKNWTKTMKETDRETLLRKVTDILPSYKTHWKSCMNLCQRPDCVKESYVTIVQSTTGKDGHSSTVTELELAFFPPNDQTTIVKSLPKMNFVYFLTQVLTGVSFWFGFLRTSSLQIIAWVKRYNTKQNGEEHENRIRVLEHKNRRLEDKNRILEQNTIGINRRLHFIKRNTKQKDEEHENWKRRIEENTLGINRRLHLLERSQGYNNLPAVEYS